MLAELLVLFAVNPSTYLIAYTIVLSCVAVASVPIPADLNAALIAIFAVCMIAS